MYAYQDIRHVHLEISSRCNAECPLCPRNFYGYPYNDGYVEHDMTVNEAQRIFSVDFIKQLDAVQINGNFGDIVMNQDAISIIEYLRSHNSNMDINVSTNAGARDKKFWQELARLQCRVLFCIDGFEDTHHLYRQNTRFDVVMKNAKTFIAAGGIAIWKMIDFAHNKHQQEPARQLSKDLGFTKFQLADYKRDNSPVFDHDGNLKHVIGNPAETNFKKMFFTRTKNRVFLKDIIDDRTPAPISCMVKKSGSVYVSSTGDVYPCCFLGFSPKTYGHGNYHAAANKQVCDLIYENNAIEHGLEHAIKWFDNVVKAWEIPDFLSGRPVICHDYCSKNGKY